MAERGRRYCRDACALPSAIDPDQAAALRIARRLSAAQIGNAPGNFIPGAPNVVASAGITLGEKTGWFGALRYRYFGPRPLTEDGAFRLRRPPVC